MHIVLWIASGIVAGWTTGLIMRGAGYGLLGDLVLGLIGGVVGGWILRSGGMTSSDTWAWHILVAVLGAIVLVGGSRLLRRL